ncbi:MAG TPA: ADOP family duplicated permease, partial [Vicinamibacterales bacterium]|nr:ADOP family duplicated permease [Vicinamibacterales bacterium]
ALSMTSLPVRAPHELVEVRLTGPDGRDGRHTGRNRQVSLPQYRAIEQRQQGLQSMLAFGDTRFNLSPSGEMRPVDGLWVSGSFFETLGVAPLVGRLIGPGDDRPDCRPNTVAVISYAWWQGEFGGRADILSRFIPLGSARVPIVGVTPPEFFGVEVGRQFSVAMPLCASGFGNRDHWWLAAIGRLESGWTRASAAAQLAQVFPEIQKETMPEYRSELAKNYLAMGVELVDASNGLSPLRRQYRQPLGILMAISALVLLMAAVNLTNLLLARATARRDEFAIRLALGGSRGRVLQQVLIESGVIAAAGAAAAIVVALAVSRSIPPLISTTVDRVHLDLSLDWRVFGFATAVAIVTSLLIGAAPAYRASRSRLGPAAARGAAANQGLGLRRALVAAQVALTLVLLFGGLLFLATFRNLSTLDVGVRERGIVVASVLFGTDDYPVAHRPDRYRILDQRLFTLPGVESAAVSYTTPMGANAWKTDVEVDGRTGMSHGNRIGPRYFETLGTPLVAGRDFTEGDRTGSPLVAIVNRSFAEAYFGGQALGRRFSEPSDTGGPGDEYEIVGVVADQKYDDLREANPHVFYAASAQQPELPLTRHYVVRSRASTAATMAAIGAAVREFDPSLGVRYTVLDTQIAEGMLRERLMARLSAMFGGVALLLAIVGLYGVVSYTVASRRSEIGVRVALGASRPRILAMILGDVGRMLAAGIVGGAVLAILASRAVASLLYGLSPNDPLVLAVAAGVLLAGGFVAAAVPAKRAAGIDPAVALRSE